MTQAISAAMILFSILVPQKGWFTPAQPINVAVKSDQDVTLVLTDFVGKPIEAKGSADVSANQSVDVKMLFPSTQNPGTYVLFATPKGDKAPPAGPPRNFLGTPLVIEALSDHRRDAPPGTIVTHVVPLQYAVMTTEAGPLKEIFYYDVAPHTVDSFLDLSASGFFDGIVFHRIVPGFVIQGGDPTGSGLGGPGYHIDAEFNDRPHQEGVLSMARNGDPNEDASSGIMPRPQFANSAGSQFFVCLDYQQTRQLDHRYTAFGKVIEGMDAVKKIAAGKIADPSRGMPEKPVSIVKVEVLPVTPKDNPYIDLMGGTPTTAPPGGGASTGN
ncbi:MAG: peptidylprolyl isomerase [Planctomycetota bacterium]|nr:peptidylprolyl isomerase [Planctomycetota bacterium]